MKRYLMEFIGAFLFTLAVALAGGNPFAVGLILLALVYIGRYISGAFYNPALTVAGFVRGMLSLEHTIWYLVAQVLGSLAALGLFYFGLGALFNHSMPVEISSWLPILIEVLFSAIFAGVMIAVNGPRRQLNNDIYGLAIGFTLVGILAFGGLYNPAIALSSLVLNGIFGSGLSNIVTWATTYVVAPLAGGILAGLAGNYFEEYEE